jgi:hypothetical protein
MEAAGHLPAPAAESSSVAVYAAIDRLNKANEILGRKLEIEPLM